MHDFVQAFPVSREAKPCQSRRKSTAPNSTSHIHHPDSPHRNRWLTWAKSLTRWSLSVVWLVWGFGAGVCGRII